MALLALRSAAVVSLTLICGLRPAAAADVPVAPPPRAVEVRPFDLTYLPPDCAAEGLPRLVVAVRPSAMFRHPGAAKLAAKADDAIGGLAREWLGAAAAGGPGTDAIDCVLLAGHVTIQHSDDAEKPNSLIAFASGIVVRTKSDFDWAGAVKAWYPKAKRVKHNGAVITLLPVPELLAQFFPPEMGGALCAAYVPDGRTLVLGPEASIRKLVDRVKAGGPAPRPAAWDEVERADLAVAVEVPDRATIDRMPPQDVAEAKAAMQIARRTHTVVFGAWACEATAVHMAFTARNPRAARRVAALLQGFSPSITAALKQTPDEEPSAHEAGILKAALGLAADGRVERVGSVVRVDAVTSDSVLDHLVPLLIELSSRASARR